MKQLVQYLATPDAQEIWVKRGGFTATNNQVPASDYPDAVAGASAKALSAAPIFRFGADDLMPSQVEDAFWKGLKEIAAMRNIPLSDLVSTIDNERQHGNLSSAIRLFVLDHYRTQAGGVTDIPAREYSSIRTMSPDLRAE